MNWRQFMSRLGVSRVPGRCRRIIVAFGRQSVDVAVQAWQAACRATGFAGMTAMASNTVVLYMTHLYDNVIAEEYERLRCQCEPRHDVRLLYDASSRRARRARRRPDAFGFRARQALERFGRHFTEPQAKGLWPGSSDLALMTYALDQPAYEFYWLIEHDVRFTGPWNCLFDVFADNQADLLTTTIRRRSEQPDWRWWSTLVAPDVELSVDEQIRCFMPVLRISRRAIEVLLAAYRQGWQGHYECTVPTILGKHGMTIEDIGGDGAFVSADNVNRFYRNTPDNPQLTPGTFVWRPILERAGDEPNKLWHPVKPSRRSIWPWRRRLAK